MALLTLLGDEDARAPASKTCPVTLSPLHPPTPPTGPVLLPTHPSTPTCPVLLPTHPPPSCAQNTVLDPLPLSLYLRTGSEAFVASSGFGICKPPSPAWLVSVGHPKVPPPLASIPPSLPSSPNLAWTHLGPKQ